jgi:sulfur carrier protein
MMVWINQKSCDLQQGSTLKEAIALAHISPPFAVAVNAQFVPKTLYDQTFLNDNDKIELIVPITGG